MHHHLSRIEYGMLILFICTHSYPSCCLKWGELDGCKCILTQAILCFHFYSIFDFFFSFSNSAIILYSLTIIRDLATSQK